MNILLCSNYSIGCVPFYVRRALLKLNHQVFSFSPDYDKDGWLHCPANVNVNNLLKDIPARIDLLLMVEASTGTKFFPQGLQTIPVPTAWWAIDNHLNYRWHKEYANLFDIAFFAQKEYYIKAQRYGVKNLHWLPLACDEEIHRDRNLQRIYDVSFVGNLTPNRKKFFDNLDINIKLESGVYLEQVGEIYSQSKIVLNISAREDLNMRFFEAMCAGALLITQNINAGIPDLFEPNKHFVFHNIKDAKNIIKYYLINEDERNQIAEAGKKLTINEHTYIKRIGKLLDLVTKLDNLAIKRNKKFNSHKIYVQESLVYRHRSFQMKNEAANALKESFKRNYFLTIAYLLRFFIHRIIERIEKASKKNF